MTVDDSKSNTDITSVSFKISLVETTCPSRLFSDIPAMFYFLEEEEELPWFLMRNKLFYVQLFNKNFEKVSTGQQLTFFTRVLYASFFLAYIGFFIVVLK